MEKKPDILNLAAAKKDKEAPTLKEISRIAHRMRGRSWDNKRTAEEV